MLVLNHTSGLITIGATHVPAMLPDTYEGLTEAARQRRDRLIQLSHGRVVLLPGANDIDPLDWAKVTDSKTGNRVLLGLIKTRRVESKGIADITGVKDVDEAIGIVKLTGDKELLGVWRAKETRKKVLAAIDAQVKDIDAMLAKATEQTADKGGAEA